LVAWAGGEPYSRATVATGADKNRTTPGSVGFVMRLEVGHHLPAGRRC
jgi:hypothetical protein